MKILKSKKGVAEIFHILLPIFLFVLVCLVIMFLFFYVKMMNKLTTDFAAQPKNQGDLLAQEQANLIVTRIYNMSGIGLDSFYSYSLSTLLTSTFTPNSAYNYRISLSRILSLDKDLPNTFFGSLFSSSTMRSGEERLFLATIPSSVADKEVPSCVYDAFRNVASLCKIFQYSRDELYEKDDIGLPCSRIYLSGDRSITLYQVRTYTDKEIIKKHIYARFAYSGSGLLVSGAGGSDDYHIYQLAQEQDKLDVFSDAKERQKLSEEYKKAMKSNNLLGGGK